MVQSPRDSWLRSGPIATLFWEISNFTPWVPGVPLVVRVGVLAAWASLIFLLLLALLQRWALKLLLSDKTFVYQSRAPTLWVKVWFMCVRLLTHRKPLLYSFQDALPRMPVPDIRDTVAKYLESAKLIQTPEEFAKTEIMARDFLKNEGPGLNFWLKVKSWLVPNYVTDW